jgi:hypothetical protein
VQELERQADAAHDRVEDGEKSNLLTEARRRPRNRKEVCVT